MLNCILKKSAGPLKGPGFFFILLLFWTVESAQAKESWTLSSSFSYSSGTYIYDSRVYNYTFYAGCYYQKDKVSLGLSVPFSIQRDKLQTESNMMTSNTGYAVSRGVPGVYLYGEYAVYPSFYVSGQIKIPTSSEVTLFNSGKFDYGLGLAWRKMFGSYKIFADAGYLVLGDPAEISYNDPFVYGLGVARHTTDGKSIVSFYYQGYQSIITGLDPPRQLSAAYYRSITDLLGITFYGSKGFSESTADYTLALGFNLTL